MSLASPYLVTSAQAEDVTVFAAASLKNALDEIATQWQAKTGNTVVISYAGSAQLAKQIQQGAPADIFISASTDWMDVLGDENLIIPNSSVTLLGNELVVIAYDPTAGSVDLSPDLDITPQLGSDGKLAMALVDSVPAGIYGKQALTSLGLWEVFEPRVVQVDNVRAALLLVSTGEATMGIVYASDARAEDGVKVVATFPPESHDPIIYPAALIGPSAKPEAQAFLDASDATRSGSRLYGTGALFSLRNKS